MKRQSSKAAGNGNGRDQKRQLLETAGTEEGQLRQKISGSFWFQPYDFDTWEEAESYLDGWLERSKELGKTDYYRINTIKIMSDQVLDFDQTLKAATINGAKTINRENEIGSIEVGKSADVMILNCNLRESNIEDMENVAPVRTFFEGETVYNAE